MKVLANVRAGAIVIARWLVSLVSIVLRLPRPVWFGSVLVNQVSVAGTDLMTRPAPAHLFIDLRNALPARLRAGERVLVTLSNKNSFRVEIKGALFFTVEEGRSMSPLRAVVPAHNSVTLFATAKSSAVFSRLALVIPAAVNRKGEPIWL